MKSKYTLDELVMDDAFIEYCLVPNAVNSTEWDSYVVQYPDELYTISEARRSVLLICAMMESRKKEIEGINRTENGQKDSNPILIFYKIAAMVIVVVGLFLVGLYYNNSEVKHNQFTAEKIVYRSLSGEKKTVVLPDSTVAILNVLSELELDKEYGIKNRNVRLVGEAFFDVSHDKKRPFVLETKGIEVKVLGTQFNVKSYLGDNEHCEAVLVKGSIELTVKRNKRKYLLHPNEKAVLDKSRYEQDDGGMQILKLEKTQDGFAETGWLDNKIVIVNQKFINIKPILERWYNVKISFDDLDVQNYTFTATFENNLEIQQILKALQSSFPFHFEIKQKEIVISKSKG